MESWQQLINTALLGTGRQALPELQTTAALYDALLHIRQDNENDREEVLLKTGALLLNFRQAGMMPIVLPEATMTACLPETKPYCHPDAVPPLTQALTHGSIALTRYWMEHCANAGCIVPARVLPTLLEEAKGNRKLREPLIACYGNRGQWLANLNADWHAMLPTDTASIAEDAWTTGTLPQRCEVLTKVRETHPEEGRQLLIDTWKQENAATKAELMDCLRTGLSAADIAWLQEATTEKSLKVKEKAWKLLRRLPLSDIVQTYWQLIKTAIQAVNGQLITSDLTLPLPAEVYQSGIDKLPPSAIKMTDETYQLQQLVAHVPCSFFTTYLEEDMPTCLQWLTAAGFEESLLTAAIRFEEEAWIIAILENTNTFYPDVFHHAPAKVLEAYALRFVEKEGSSVILRMGAAKEEWGLTFTGQVFRFVAMHPYSYNMNFFLELAHLLPVAILEVDEKSYFGDILYNQQAWKNLRDKLFELIRCKATILQQFQITTQQ
ncbi:MAG: hypothetical protein JO154_05055 [Chitinophaga sp.]|uniref:DUF5691 domain-containing protein n=1 Tax=Chitinophaga sp. TaxID=1869181 RepID=UPI0025C2D6DE|nr:DUF5691 domain-containing protein [Chitinophaga sp.]MBV8251958.1 hypothetical protein [Chitinophaga sp.]